MFYEPLIEAYVNKGGRVKGLKFFEVMAAVRRITDLINVLDDNSAGGLRYDIVDLMRKEKEHFLKVHDFLEERNGIRFTELDQLLADF